jgi:uncharacterized protein YhbP (UPF0306 family)
VRITAKLAARETDQALLADSVTDILSGTRLLALATVGPSAAPSICNAYFAFDPSFRLFILTPPATDHSTNIAHDPRVAAAVTDTQQTGDNGKRGLQIAGSAYRATGLDLLDGLAAYRERFPATREVLASSETLETSTLESRLYVIKPAFVKVFDERIFGPEVWVFAEVES